MDLTPRWQDVIDGILEAAACQGKSKRATERREYAAREIRRLAMIADEWIAIQKAQQKGNCDE
jgi:hypothetical protein